LIGMSPLEAALIEARTDISAAKSNLAFFENDAIPANVYILDDNLGKDAQEAAFTKIKEQFSGAENRNKSAVLGGVKEIKTISTTPKDMEFISGRQFNTDKVCSVYGVPKFILGYTDQVNYSNGEKLMEKFYLGTVQPIETSLEESINDRLLPKLGITTVKMTFNPQTFDESAKKTLALAEYNSGVLTLRQYKVLTGHPITAEDENEPMIDKHIIVNGGGAKLMEDVGVELDPAISEEVAEEASAILNAIKAIAYERTNK